MKPRISTAQPYPARKANQRQHLGRHGRYTLAGMALGCALCDILLVNACSENHLVVVLDKADAGQIGGAGGQAQSSGGTSGQTQSGAGGQTQSSGSTGGQAKSLGGTGGQTRFPGGAGGQAPGAGGQYPSQGEWDAGQIQTLICFDGYDPCNRPEDCCSGMCNGQTNRCPVVSQFCHIIGETCSPTATCCSGACADSGQGTTRCQALSGCRPENELCHQNAECCSGVCTLDRATNVSHCSQPTNTNTCAPAGELCATAATSGTPPLDCCDSKPGGSGVDTSSLCSITDTGTARCKPAGQCASNGKACKLPEECCSHYCLPDSNQNLTCAPSCASKGAACQASPDCCTGYCSNGLCKDSGVPCYQLGVSCQDGTQCCSGNCDGSPATCRVPSTTTGT